jgi:16S rRNA (uracil1498-N3)-methyltransferase
LTSTHHFFVDPGDVRNGIVALHGQEAHHAAHVLRVRRGESISVADGTGRVIEAVVSDVGDTVEAEVRSVREIDPLIPAITLFQGIAKGERMDAVVQKSVEIGVARIVPVMCERTIARWDETKRANAVQRWREIAKGAGKQCGTAWFTHVEDVADTFDTAPPTVALDPDSASRLRDVLPAQRPDTLSLVIGPEGGLSESELDTLREKGVATATLGPRVLRTETAGPVAAALILYAYGSLG